LPDVLRNGKKTRDIKFKDKPEHLGRVELKKNGIIAIVSNQRKQGDTEKWLLTGFDSYDDKKTASEAIQTVIAQYGYTPEFSDIRKQVGTVVASISCIPQPAKKSRGKLWQ
jgi:hypothetical protein